MESRDFPRILYPTKLNVERLHAIIIQQRGTSGWNSPGLLDVGLEWAKSNITYSISSPGLLQRAGALMYGYVTFHPFADGNKRTALMTTSMFFFLNQYVLRITDDAPEFTRDLAISCITENNPAIDEIYKVASWLRTRIVPVPSGLARALVRFLVNNTSLDEDGWEILLSSWLKATTKRFEELSKKNGPTRVNSPSHPS